MSTALVHALLTSFQWLKRLVLSVLSAGNTLASILIFSGISEGNKRNAFFEESMNPIISLY
jgi:hypothetical protein